MLSLKGQTSLLFALFIAFLVVPGALSAQTRCVAGSWGVLRYVHGAVNVRAGRRTATTIRLQLAAGQCVRADFLEGGWYAVFPIDATERDETKALGYVLATLLKTSPQPAPAVTRPAPAPRRCCRICRRGKACGNSCIARNRTCRVGPGCACNGGEATTSVTGLFIDPPSPALIDTDLWSSCWSDASLQGAQGLLARPQR